MDRQGIIDCLNEGKYFGFSPEHIVASLDIHTKDPLSNAALFFELTKQGVKFDIEKASSLRDSYIAQILERRQQNAEYLELYKKQKRSITLSLPVYLLDQIDKKGRAEFVTRAIKDLLEREDKLPKTLR